MLPNHSSKRSLPCTIIQHAQVFLHYHLWSLFPGRTTRGAKECGGGNLKGCCFEQLMFSTSRVITMDCYAIITLCHASFSLNTVVFSPNVHCYPNELEHTGTLNEFKEKCLVITFWHPKDKRLHSGDQILRIGDTDLAGMNSEQVAQVR